MFNYPKLTEFTTSHFMIPTIAKLSRMEIYDDGQVKYIWQTHGFIPREHWMEDYVYDKDD